MKNVIASVTFILFFFIAEKNQAQEIWTVELGSSLVQYKKKYTNRIGDLHVYQFPRITVTRKIGEKFAISGSTSYSFSGTLGPLTNDVNYFYLGVSSRYELYKSLLFNPYASAGLNFVSHKIANKVGLNVGIGNTLWVSENMAINTQVSYNISDKILSHIQYSIGFVVDTDLFIDFGW